MNYNPRIALEENIERSHRRINDRKELLDVLPIELIHQAFPQGYWHEYWETSFEFTLPMSVALVEEFKEFARLQGLKMTEVRQHVWNSTKNGDAGYFADVWVDDNHYFNLAFRSDRPGSTCVLKQIGVEEKPVFEVVCTEGASESW